MSSKSGAKVRISEDNAKKNVIFVFIVERKYLRQSQSYEFFLNNSIFINNYSYLCTRLIYNKV